MSNIFLISDTHWGHANILGFKDDKGVLLRPEFSCVEEMDEAMVDNWNKVVGKNDKVYHLGDVAMGKRGLVNLSRCNGTKVLVKGNHDKETLNEYVKYFKDIRGSHQFDGLLLTHIPVHTGSLARWPTNVHGHLHSYSVRDSNDVHDPRYFCVSVEQIGYTPISLENLKKDILYRKEKLS